MKLKDRVAIVTGGATGIGRGITERFAGEGARVIIAQRRIELAEDLAMSLRAQGYEVAAVEVDISIREQVKQLVDYAINHFNRIDILVNNASVTGIAAYAPFLQCSDDHLTKIIDVNLKGTVICSQEVAKVMATHQKGVIVHISSVAAYAAQEGAAVYTATKAAIVALTKCMSLELSVHGIRVNCIAPGDILVESNEEIVEDLKSRGMTGRYLRRIPLGRRGAVDEVASAALFLSSDEASYIHGTTLIVDGGLLSY